ncbi:hypothetical protein GBAR_LOCUS12089 [Geodia barretti]|uniref:Uncharacterized protein n=1 Tax=Geodia barretti TaxID=519541 RepID=A0AA35RYQ4_GEOBA|nr:hypothetical protein GBAR_LOCUS12089 [Geodia barretti]
MSSAPQSLLGTGGGNVTCLSSGVLPSNAVTGPTIAATQPALGLNSSLSTNQLTYQMVPTLTNHIVASTQPRLATSLNSSLSPATGISPLRPSPVLSLSPVSPALGAQALGHSQQLATAAQPLQALSRGVGGVPASAALLQSALLSPPPARRVLFHTPPLHTPSLQTTSLLTPSPSSLPLQHRPLMSALPLQQPLPQAAVQVQPSLQPGMATAATPTASVHVCTAASPAPSITTAAIPAASITTTTATQQPVLLQQHPQQPVLLQQHPQQPVLLQQHPQQPVLLQQQSQQPVLLQQQSQQPVLLQQQPQQSVYYSSSPSSHCMHISNQQELWFNSSHSWYLPTLPLSFSPLSSSSKHLPPSPSINRWP